MKNTLIFVAFLFFLIVFISRRNARVRSYICVFEKTVYLPKELASTEVLTYFPDHRPLVELKQKAMLPFVPQIGMSISEVNESRIVDTGTSSRNEHIKVSFSSGKIIHMNWSVGQKLLQCRVATDEIGEKDKIGPILIKYLRDGWVLDNPEEEVTSAIKFAIEKWKKAIENKEQEAGKTLVADREEFNRVTKVVNSAGVDSVYLIYLTTKPERES